jgi:hypothetical protein
LQASPRRELAVRLANELRSSVSFLGNGPFLLGLENGASLDVWMGDGDNSYGEYQWDEE